MCPRDDIGIYMRTMSIDLAAHFAMSDLQNALPNLPSISHSKETQHMPRSPPQNKNRPLRFRPTN